MISSQPFIEGRGEVFCRGCLGESLFSALDLGNLPIANELNVSPEGQIEKFPLHLRVCANCGLGQVADVVTPERIFRDYRYLSSMSTTFLKHASDFVNEQFELTTFLPTDWVLEIASNDGYLLRNFIPHQIKTVGIEPAENVAELSRQLGIETISEFFSSKLAVQLVTKFGFPKLIIANNVMAHVPDLADFIRGLSILCGPETKISIENPSLSNILLNMQFDTIYHEHFSYLSASSVARLSENFGLSLTRVEELSIHGGSNRYWLQKIGLNPLADDSVSRVIETEFRIGLFDPQNWHVFSENVQKILDEFQLWIQKTRNSGGRIYGYGAAAKASTLLNSIGIDHGLVDAIADVSLEKQGRFMPPCGIEIISPDELFSRSPTDVVIFPWNIQGEIASFLRSNFSSDARLWCAIPEMHEITDL